MSALGGKRTLALGRTLQCGTRASPPRPEGLLSRLNALPHVAISDLCTRRSIALWGTIMFKASLIAGLIGSAVSTAALAENWVTTPASPLGLTSIYDADSVYVEASTGLVYVRTCSEKPCDSYSKSRYDCDARSVSDDIGGVWSPPATRSPDPYDMADNTYNDGTTAAEILEAVCAQRTSWPRR